MAAMFLEVNLSVGCGFVSLHVNVRSGHTLPYAVI